MKTYCSVCYLLKQMYKRGLAYRGYVGYYGGMADQASFFRELYRKVCLHVKPIEHQTRVGRHD